MPSNLREQFEGNARHPTITKGTNMNNATQTPAEIHPLSALPETHRGFVADARTPDDPTLVDERVFEDYITTRYGFPSLFTGSLLPVIERSAKAAGREFVRGRVERRNEDGRRIGPFCYMNSDAMILAENVIIDIFATIHSSVRSGQVATS